MVDENKFLSRACSAGRYVSPRFGAKMPVTSAVIFGNLVDSEGEEAPFEFSPGNDLMLRLMGMRVYDAILGSQPLTDGTITAFCQRVLPSQR